MNLIVIGYEERLAFGALAPATIKPKAATGVVLHGPRNGLGAPA
jgi:hypothetical protein